MSLLKRRIRTTTTMMMMLRHVAYLLFVCVGAIIGKANAQLLSLTTCPAVGTPKYFTDLNVTISNSIHNLCTLTRLTNNSILIPVARSYDNQNWEISAGPFAGVLTTTCVDGSCSFNLSPLEASQTYVLTSYNYTTTQQGEVARFLEQATFGPTRDSINNWNYASFSGSFKAWIQDQMDTAMVPLTSHREYYRRRANPRLTMPYTGASSGPNPCDTDSRWRNFAITVKDKDLSFVARSLNSDGIAPFVLEVNGFARTIVPSIAFSDPAVTFQLDTTYTICYDVNNFFLESFSSPLSIRGSNDTTCYFLEGGIPLVDLSDDETLADYIIDLPDIGSVDLQPIDDHEYNSVFWSSFLKGDEFRLVQPLNTAQCAVLDEQIFLNPERTYPLPPIFGRTMDANNNFVYLLYDPRLVFVENTLENPIPDGGGQVSIDSEGAVYCANAPRTPFNEDYCVLSTAATACSATTPPTFSIPLINETLLGLYQATGQYIYAIDNLPMDDFHDDTVINYVNEPCEKNSDRVSRWQRMDDMTNCTGDYRIIEPDTEAIFATLLQDGFGNPNNPNQWLKDVERHQSQYCNASDVSRLYLGFVKSVTAGVEYCWHHVHPNHLNVYDMTNWVANHPGGPNKITQWAEQKNTGILRFPDSHHPEGNQRFFDSIVNHPIYYPLLGKLYDSVPYESLPLHLQIKEVEDRFGTVAVNTAKRGVVVCGSQGEVANDPSLGSGFDVDKDDDLGDDTTPLFIRRQRNTVWALIALTSNDQLRQRVAFALSQILVITPDLMSDPTFTETVVNYYDIFVRNAFGNYRDILREVSFSQRMGQMLSYRNNKGLQYYVDRGEVVNFPDENYAREIMQLFSIGLIKLNMDGTPKLDSDGNEIQTYDDSDIISFARAWTGFKSQKLRGNTEDRVNRLDPMMLLMDWRDEFPKSNLDGGFIGDKSPLCVDLPTKHHLRAGATYRLLGGRVNPELQKDRDEWEDDPDLLRLELTSTSELFAKLCDPATPGGEDCRFPGKVVLDSNIGCNAADPECNVDTIRTVRVQALPFPIYYEYVRRPCVEQAFFNNGIQVKDWTTSKFVVSNSMCADRRRDVAAEICCNPGWEDSTDLNDHGYRYCNYHAERMTYDTAVSRCAANQKEQCDAIRIREYQAGVCGKDQNNRYYFSWHSASCSLQVKVRGDGAIAIVHNPPEKDGYTVNVAKLVNKDSINFFKVPWQSESFPTIDDECGGAASSCVVDGQICICDTIVEETPVFTISTGLDKASVLSNLQIGAFEPGVFDANTYTQISCSVTGVDIFKPTADGPSCDDLTTETIFSVVDDNGVLRYLKNMASTVKIDTIHSFRNPVHYISLVDPAVRDAYHETEAVLDYYFYHENHPPFLSKLMIQRFGISNPSPRFVETVAQAYKTGMYDSIGSGEYGDLKAMIAAILLDRESRSVSLDADPTHGSLREPIIKVVSSLRALGYHHDSPLLWPLLSNLVPKIGQSAYDAPSVFNFFMPGYIPPGPIGTASLYAPEAQVLNGAKVTNILDGFYALVDYGLMDCLGGFSENLRSWVTCGRDNHNFKSNFGRLTYNATELSLSTIDEVVSDLSLLLTASRLSESNANIIKEATRAVFEGGDTEAAIRQAQKYILSSPEFHSTNLVTKAATSRSTTEQTPPASSEPYKAVIFLMQAGGADTWNMLVPKGDCPTANPNNVANLYDEYKTVRGDHAKELADLLDLDASTSNQWCNLFGVNKELSILHSLYNDGDALFFANTGVLQKPVDKKNWTTTKSSLFSHNSQQEEAMRMDIEDNAGTTGVLGRMADALKEEGYSTAVAGIDSECIACTRDANLNYPVTGLSSSTPRQFPSDEIMLKLNDATEVDSGMMAETWSSKLFQSVAENSQMTSILESEEYAVREFGSSDLDENFRVTAQWIKARAKRGVSREAFFIKHSSYDHHDTSPTQNFEELLKTVNAALTSFVDEMKRDGIWDGVTILSVSDFGRTLVPNGNGEAGQLGTDHGWGGHYFMLGGSVKGKQILGNYPNDLTDDGPLNMGQGRGRMIPDTPWESVWNGITQWMGITSDYLIDNVLPNRNNFPHCTLFTDQMLFEDGQIPPYQCKDASDSQYESTPSNPSASMSSSTILSDQPSIVPSTPPTFSSVQSESLTKTIQPSVIPSDKPSLSPSAIPSDQPSILPSTPPTSSSISSESPTKTIQLSMIPSDKPSLLPSLHPSSSADPSHQSESLPVLANTSKFSKRAHRCAGTRLGDPVNNNGCSVFQVVGDPCDYPVVETWLNEVDATASAFMDSGFLNQKQYNATLAEAKDMMMVPCKP